MSHSTAGMLYVIFLSASLFMGHNAIIIDQFKYKSRLIDDSIVSQNRAVKLNIPLNGVTKISVSKKIYYYELCVHGGCFVESKIMRSHWRKKAIFYSQSGGDFDEIIRAASGRNISIRLPRH